MFGYPSKVFVKSIKYPPQFETTFCDQQSGVNVANERISAVMLQR